MGISVFPAGGGGEFITNDFVVDMNNTDNNVIDLGRTYAAGSYDVTLATADNTFDIYALDAEGTSVGYTNNATLITSAGFTQLVILGVGATEKITFAFSGASNDATSEGDAPGAGAYLESINPSDLPNQDDTANIIGGNFASDVEIYFESGTVSTEAKNVVRSDSTALVVTRPDELDPALDPWDVKAINPGVTPPTGSDVHILAGTVDAGALPVWTTTSPLAQGTVTQPYSATVVATDADGDVSYSITAGSLPTGLSLDGSTGIISGTPTTGSETFTIQAEDEGGNTNDREFNLPLLAATGGSVSTVGNYTVHTFNSSGDFETFAPISSAEYIILAGGGGAASANRTGGGGGGGGLLSSISGFNSGSATTALSSINISAGTLAVTIGAGGAPATGNGNVGQQGSDSSLATVGNAIGGGGGATPEIFGSDGGNGGSGGGADYGRTPGSGTSGQGFSGGSNNDTSGNTRTFGGGGGSGGAGSNSGNGGRGTHNFLDQRGWGAGGGGGTFSNNSDGGDGGGSTGNDNTTYAGFSENGSAPNAGIANFGGGGGGGGGNFGFGSAGGSGKVVIRYEA